MNKITLCLLLTCFSAMLSAQTVTLDSTFGVNGQVNTDVYDPYGNPYGNNIVLLPNGEVAIIGLVLDSTALPVVAKFGADGLLDSSFTQTLPSLGDRSSGLADQSDGKFLATGIESASPYRGLIYRINPEGGLDPTFGSGGVSKIVVKVFDNIIPMELSTGALLVFGDENIPNEGITLFAAHLHSDGKVNPDFGENGYFRFGLEDQYVLITAAVEQPDGKILFAGMAGWNLFLLRMHPNGTIDLSFGTEGYLIDPMPGGGEAYGIALQPDGKIVACGYGDPSLQPIIARYHTNGSRDTTFGNQGVVYFSEIEDPTEGIGIEVLPNGKIISGISNFYANNFYLAQLLPNGERDSTFGLNGVYEYLNNDFRARAMSRSANMLAVSGREEANSGFNKIVLLRFLLDLNVGTLNPSEPDPTLWVYPNPIMEQFTLEFGLVQQEQVSIYLTDIQGKRVQSFVQKQIFEPGDHLLSLSCPGHLPAGNYILTMEAAGKKMTSIQIIKK